MTVFQAVRCGLVCMALILTQTASAEAAFDPTQTFATGAGVIGGKTNQPLSATIQCVDVNGDPMVVSPTGITWSGILTGPDTITATIIENLDGTLTLNYTAPIKGVYSLNITANSIQINASPYTVTITGPYAPNCQASGTGVTGGQIFTSVHLTVLAKDLVGNLILTGNDNFTLEVLNPLGRRETATFVGTFDGQYHGSYIPRLPGPYKVSIKLDGVDIAGSPFRPFMRLRLP